MHILSFYINKLQEQPLRCPIKALFLKLFQNSPKNTCFRVFFFNKVAGPQPGAVILLSLIQMLSKKFLLTIHFFVEIKNFVNSYCKERPQIVSGQNKYINVSTTLDSLKFTLQSQKLSKFTTKTNNLFIN